MAGGGSYSGKSGGGGFFGGFSGLTDFVTSRDFLALASKGIEAYSTIQASNAAAEVLELEGRQMGIQAGLEIEKGRARDIENMEKLNDLLAYNTAAAGASSLQSSGSVAQASIDAIEKSNQQLSTSRTNAAMNAASRRITAASKISQAQTTRGLGRSSALMSFGSYFTDAAARGGPSRKNAVPDTR